MASCPQSHEGATAEGDIYRALERQFDSQDAAVSGRRHTRLLFIPPAVKVGI